MLFNTFTFLLAFLPATLLLYFALGSRSPRYAVLFLGLASLVFYGWWDPRYLALLIGSMAFNYAAGTRLLRLSRLPEAKGPCLWLLRGAIAANLALLAFFKYVDFFFASANQLIGDTLPLLHLVLPLGISFFTFTQIAFLVDAAKGDVDALTPLNYGLFVSFFPHLIAGPILHHREMMPQFQKQGAARFNADNFALGLYLLGIGLAKKLIIADQFAPLANTGFESWQTLGTSAAWLTSVSYSIQLYFDFSGYTDMALGLAWMFNIRLPQNFNSPYKATSIQDFWRRWHMTLSRFLRDYLYLPLGGDRKGRTATLRNLMLTFLLGGLWHGAGWTFIVWGALHGGALVLQRLWNWAGLRMPRLLGWASTLLFVNFAWVYFRSTSLAQANSISLRMLGLEDSGPAISATELIGLASKQAQGLFGSNSAPLPLVLGAFAAVLCASWVAPNTIALGDRFRPTLTLGLLTGIVLAFCLLSMHRPAEFLYFNF